MGEIGPYNPIFIRFSWTHL